MRLDETTGSLAAPSDRRVLNPISIIQPQGVSDAHWAKISADTNFMAWLEGQPMVVRYEQIAQRLAQIDRSERPRPDIDAHNEAMRREHEALAANPTDAQRIASLEAALIELRVRVATLEAAQPRKPAKVTRLSSSTDPTPRPAA